jgi:hypothetical protein
MDVKEVHILPTNKTPEIILKPGGVIKISGRAIDESRSVFSDQIMGWIDAYLLNPAKLTELSIDLEYLNSYNSIVLASVIRKLALLSQQSKVLVIKWFIDEDDDDLLERGKYISSTFNIPIEFIVNDQNKN